ncbi:MAG: ATPase, T2SS/T4P/T4SS family [Bdellovibrionales bacterium]
MITGLRPNKTVGDLTRYTGSINAQSIGAIVAQHASGLHYIGAVTGPDQTLQARADLIKKQISLLSPYYNYIIVDLGNEMGDLQTSMVEIASAVLIVTTPEVLVVNQTRRLLNELLAATFPADMFHIVVNKMSRGGINPQTIGQNLRRPVIGVIPQDDISAMTALQSSTPFILTSQNSPLRAGYTQILRNLTGGVLQKLKQLQRPSGAGALGAAQAKSNLQLKSTSSVSSGRKRGISNSDLDPETLLKLQIHKGLIEEMDLKKDLSNTNGDPQKEAELRQKTQRMITQLTDRLGGGLSRDDRSRIIKQVLDESLGLGALEELIADPTVSEIMVNGAKHVFVEKNGKIQLSEVDFTSNDQLRKIIERIVSPLGRQINEKTPYVDARLADGSRVNAIIEPLAIDGPAITIRKFAKEAITEDHYVKWGTSTRSMLDFLKICVEQGLNVIVSGGTGSGKTTLLNMLSGYIPSNERIITCEDAAELQLRQEHVVRLETRPANMEGTGEITIRDLIKNSLRMRPDRIIVGECRDGAALDMLSAMNTGHDGSMTTVHANNPREGISRIETLCMMAGMDLPAKAIREQIAGAVDLIVQIGRLSDGSRKIKQITEVGKLRGEAIELQDIFVFKETGFDKNRKIVGQFQPTGLIPSFIEKFEARGVTIPRNLFSMSSAPQSATQSAEGDSAKRMAPSRRGLSRTPTRTQVPTKKKVSGED